MDRTLFFYSLVAAGAFAVSAALTPMVAALARRWGLVDLPGLRKVHTTPTPRIGGLAIAAAFAVTAVPAMAWAYHEGVVIPPELIFQLVTIALVGLFVLAVGLLDDIRPIPPKYKALALAAAAAAVCGSGARIDGLVVETGQTVLDLSVLSWPLTILWIVGLTTSVNFIDGLDGLSASLTALAAAVLAAAGIAAGSVAATLLPLCLLGAILGFLPLNWHPAKTFMGDSGTLFIGFILASAAVLAAPRVGTMHGLVIPALAMSVPILDTAVTLFRRRVVQRCSIFSAERGHIHHRLLDLGLPQPKAVLVILATSLAAVGIGWLSMLGEGWATLGGLSLVVPLLLGLFRAAGSVRSHEFVKAIRSKRAMDRDNNAMDRAFEELQLLFRETSGFGAWWQNLCAAATKLDLARVELAVTNRDGSDRRLAWTPTHGLYSDCEMLSAVVPVRERRGAGPLQARVEVPAARSLESAGHRVALFSRLIAEHSLADLPDSTPDHNLGEQDAAAGSWAALSRIAGWHKIARRGGADATEERGGGRDGRAAAASPAKADDNGAPGHRPLAKIGPRPPRVALVHDFLYVYGGAERVLEQMIEVYPEADVFSLFDFVPQAKRGFLRGRPVTTSFIQRLPMARRKHRAYLPLMPLAVEQLDVSGYDIVLSSSYMAAKGVITGPDQLHVCYCHSPVRYAWDLQHQYLAQAHLGWGPRAMLARSILHYIRTWDARSALGVDAFIANSGFVARRIEKVYRRDARVIYPPVDVDGFGVGGPREAFYVTASRLVPYKRVDLIVEAFRQMPDRKLVVVGEGPEFDRIRAASPRNVRLVGWQAQERLVKYLQLARAFIFAAEEDFGIVPVEAMACGTPVIAYGRGGVAESVQEGESGMFFYEQTPRSLVDAIDRFEEDGREWDPARVRAAAERFAADRFRLELRELVSCHWSAFKAARLRRPGDGSVHTHGLGKRAANGTTQATTNGRTTNREPVVPVLSP